MILGSLFFVGHNGNISVALIRRPVTKYVSISFLEPYTIKSRYEM